jgi:hypothetical protein
MKEVKIFCPKCEYVLLATDRWICIPACGCLWNTFDTCGVCPKCGKNWEDTACPACHRWSPHADWYHEFQPDQEKQADVHVGAV